MSEEAKSQKKQKSPMPSRTLHIEIGDNPYEIKFPTNGQLIDIERMKIQLTNGTHKDMLSTMQPSTMQAYLLAEVIATFTVLIPDLVKKDIATKSLLDLDPIQSKPLVKAYTKQYYPWFNSWMNVINEDEVEEQEDNDKTE